MALTEKDLRAIANLIKVETLGLADKIDGLPTRDEIAAHDDRIMGELQAMRQEHTMLNGLVREHEDRITTLEEIHPDGEHAH